MKLLEWFGIGAGSACYLWAWRYWAGKIAWNEKHSNAIEPSGGDIVWGIVVGSVAAALSPALLPWQWLRQRTTFQSFLLRRVMYVPKEHK